jgi:hypothetical protein
MFLRTIYISRYLKRVPISWLDRCSETRSSSSNSFKSGIYPNNIHIICSPATQKSAPSLHEQPLMLFGEEEKIGVYSEKHRNP